MNLIAFLREFVSISFAWWERFRLGGCVLMARSGLWSCRKAEEDALAHPEKIVRPFLRKSVHGKAQLRERAERWIEKANYQLGNWTYLIVIKAYVAGFRAGKKAEFNRERYLFYKRCKEKVTKMKTIKKTVEENIRKQNGQLSIDDFLLNSTQDHAAGLLIAIGELVKENKVIIVTEYHRLVWIYYPETFRRLEKVTR